MNSYRKNAVIVGALFIAATVAGVLGGVLAGTALGSQDYLIELSADESSILIAALLEVIMAVAVAGIAIAIYPVLKRHSETLAVGYVGLRVLEAAVLMVFPLALLSLLKVSQGFVAAGMPDSSHFQALGALLLRANDLASLIGATIVFCLGALVLNYVLYESRLVPRFISVWGLIGAGLYLAGGLLGILGLGLDVVDLLAIPIAVNEMVLAVWLIARGFSPSARGK